MKAGRDQRVDRWFWRVETDRHRWSVRLHRLTPGNWLRLNLQPTFAELRLLRCVVLCHSRLDRPR
jgi:hypothetical protein